MGRDAKHAQPFSRIGRGRLPPAESNAQPSTKNAHAPPASPAGSCESAVDGDFEKAPHATAGLKIEAVYETPLPCPRHDGACHWAPPQRFRGGFSWRTLARRHKFPAAAPASVPAVVWAIPREKNVKSVPTFLLAAALRRPFSIFRNYGPRGSRAPSLAMLRSPVQGRGGPPPKNEHSATISIAPQALPNILQPDWTSPGQLISWRNRGAALRPRSKLFITVPSSFPRAAAATS